MWTMGYNDGGGEFHNNMSVDSFNGSNSNSSSSSSRKLRPLIPRPTPVAAARNHSTATPCLRGLHGADLLALNHHLHLAASVAAEQTKRVEQLSNNHAHQVVVSSSRWNPTPEQLQTLEELYRGGTRTPSAEQIQHITSQLRRYGKIEGKNVFYWFQNHKARERQKRRRQLIESSTSPNNQQQPRDYSAAAADESFERNKEQPGTNKTGFEVELTKNWPPSTSCCSTIAEKAVSIERRAAAAAKISAASEEFRADGWVQFEEQGELQQRRNMVAERRNATWQMKQLLSSSSPNNNNNNNTLLRNSAISPSTTAAAATVSSVFKKKAYHQHLNNSHIIITAAAGGEAEDGGDAHHQTLQLFPLRSGDRHASAAAEKETDQLSFSAMTSSSSSSNSSISNFTPCQFFEFLPLKN